MNVSTVNELKSSEAHEWMKLCVERGSDRQLMLSNWLIATTDKLLEGIVLLTATVCTVYKHRPTTALYCTYIKSHSPTNAFTQSHTHEQDQLCEMTVCHIALQHYSDSQLHLCWKAVCRRAFLFDSCSKKDCSPIYCFFLLSTCTFFNMLEHLEDLRDKGNSISVTQALWKCM